MSRLHSIRRPVVTVLSVLTLGVAGTAAASVHTPAGDRQDAVPAAVAVRAGQGADAWARATLRRMSLPEKVGQLFVSLVHGTTADEVDPKNQRDFGVDTPAQIVRKYKLGGVIYFNNSDADNIVSPQQVAALSNGLQRTAMRTGTGLPLTIGTDQESGKVTRIESPATEFPGAMPIGATRSTRDATEAAAIMGAELRAMGITQDYAPDADVNSNPANPVIGVRSVSSDPTLAANIVAAQVRGFQDSGRPWATVSAAAKHFPGHGDTATDSHAGLPVINHTKEQWLKVDAPPFRAAIKAGIDTIMSGHLEFPKIDPSGEPGTLSPKILTGLLRDELGYNGVVITDSLRMEGVRTLHPDSEIPVLALKAGADQLLMPANLDVAVDSVLKAVQSGELSMQRIDTSVLRILKAKFHRGVLTHPLVDVHRLNRVVGTKAHRATAQRITDASTTVLRNDAGLLPLKSTPRRVLVVGGSTGQATTFAGQLARRGATTSTVPIDGATTDESIAKATAAAKNADLVVMLTYKIGAEPKQLELLQKLDAGATPVLAAATDVPYDAGFVPGQQTWVATYSTRAVATESLAKVMFGELSPRGKLPVDVPDGTNQDAVKYPFGTGLTW